MLVYVTGNMPPPAVHPGLVIIDDSDSVRRSKTSHSENVLLYDCIHLLLFRRHLSGDFANKSNARAGDFMSSVLL